MQEFAVQLTTAQKRFLLTWRDTYLSFVRSSKQVRVGGTAALLTLPQDY